jgi:hypothetical protein
MAVQDRLFCFNRECAAEGQKTEWPHITDDRLRQVTVGTISTANNSKYDAAFRYDQWNSFLPPKKE